MLLQSSKSGDMAMFVPEDCPVVKPHQRRWLLAFTAIYCTIVFVSLSKKVPDTNTQVFARRRWLLAFTAIYCTRVLVSLSRKVLDTNTRVLAGVLPSPSDVAVDIQPVNENDPREDHLPLFNIDQTTLTDMVRERNFDCVNQFGGVKVLAAILETNEKDGINGSETNVAHRTSVFGCNKYKNPPTKSFQNFVFEAFKDTTIIELLVCAILSLGFGIELNGAIEGWYNGGSIVFAVFLLVAVSAVSNFKQCRQFEKLSSERSDIKVEVVRDGQRQHISIFKVVVGDMLWLKIGDQIPADGLFFDGHSLKVDESSMKGKSDHVDINDTNPFLLSGTKVTDGCGLMLVTSVGMNTAWGGMISSISRNLDEQTPLQARLNKLTSYIGKLGFVVAVLVLVVLLIRYFTGNTEDERGNQEFNGSKTNITDIMNAAVCIFAAAVTIMVVGNHEGLPLAVTLSLAYSMKRMMADHAMVRKLSSCETVGSATTICTDKTGTLTLKKMKVTEFWLGKEAMKDKTSSEIEANVLELLQQGVALNTTGSVCKPLSASIPMISGSPTEMAILSWAVFDLGMDMDELRQTCEILHVEAFNSEKKRSGVSMRKNREKTIHTHWKGAAEMILEMCSDYYVRSGVIKALDDEEKMKFKKIIEDMAAKSLRCIAFAHKKIAEENGKVAEKIEEIGLTLLGLVGLKDPCRPGVRTAVQSFRDAGVNIKMITGDNVFTAKAIAIECGILKPNEDLNNEAIVEGVTFRNYSHEERMRKIDTIRVMARSSPFDKLLMVQCLKQKGHVVAVTGDGTNDALALKEADIGLSMGIQGTEVAKESSDIVILDDNFTSVVTVLRWGRCVYNNIQKFIQFQLTVNAAALVINLVAAVFSGEVPLTTVQLPWLNLIMDTLGALALATEEPMNDLMTKPPVGRFEPLITNVMWRNLIAQALYQITVLLTLQFKGRDIFGVNEKVKNTLIFNSFVLCQVFNEFNARKLENKNIFEGIHKKRLFMAIIGITIVLQVEIVEFLRRFSNTERLNWVQWGACIGIAALSWPIGWLVKCIPVPKHRTSAT